MTSEFSFLTSILLLNIAMIAVSLLRRKTAFLVRYSTTALLLLVGLFALRLVLPLDFKFSLVIESWTVLPFLRDVLMVDVMPGAEFLKLGTLLLGAWVLGSAIALGRIVRRLVADRRARKRYRLLESEQVARVCCELNLPRTRVLVTDDIAAPMMTGIVTAQIYLPPMRLSDQELRLVIEHEYQHFKSHDILIKLFYMALLVLFWWNPVVHQFRRELDQLLELRCDQKVTARMDDEGKRRYLGAILAVVKQMGSGRGEVQPAGAASLVSIEVAGLVKQRFQVVLNENQKSARPQAALTACLIGLFLLSFLVILQPAGSPPAADLEEDGAIAVTAENAYIVMTPEGEAHLYVDGEFRLEIGEEYLHLEPYTSLAIYEEGMIK